MKAISFLGTGKYETVTYYWQQHEFQTNLFPEALVKIFKPEKLFLLVTPTVKKHNNFKNICERLRDSLQPIEIPEGKSEKELWQIFERCVETVNEGDEILLDITHAFRSIPMIVFAVAIYLRRAKNVNIKHIIYGAYEAREPFRDPPLPSDRAPIFDLTTLIDLIDWTSGAEFLLRRSDAKIMGERLRQIHRSLWRDRTSEDLPKRLRSLGNELSNFSEALHLARPIEVMESAGRILDLINEVKPEIEKWAKPFGVILESLEKEVEKFAYESPENLSAENLKKQLTLIDHYLNKGLILQAVALAREWIISFLILKRGEPEKWLNRNYREDEIEKALKSSIANLMGKKEQIPEWFKQIENFETITKIYDDVSKLRNDLAHCGMRKDHTSIEGIQSRSKEIHSKLKLLIDSLNK